MVVTARRAAPEGGEAFVELAESTAPRRGERRAMPRGVRLALAPLTALTVVGLVAGAALLPLDKGRVERADPDYAVVAPSTALTPARSSSRTLDRVPLSRPIAPEPEPSTASSRPAEPESSAAPKVDGKKADTKKAEEKNAETEKAGKADDAPDYEELGDTAGKRYATSGLNVRVGPGAEHDVRTTVQAGEELVVTDRTDDGWRQVVWKKRAGWVKSSYLTKTKPKESEESSGEGSGSKDSDYSSASCPKAGGLEKNLTSRATSVLRAVCAEFPSVKSYGGYRAGDSGYHGSGRAIDVMISGDAGWEIAEWARANAGSLGIVEVIYEQKIWTKQRSGDGWRSMSDRGGATANHYDHVHLSIR